MSLFGGKYQLGPGDAAPFAGSEEEARENFLTHKFEEVTDPLSVGVSPKPEFQTVERCSVCLMYTPSEAVKYPCGKVARLGPSEYLMLDDRPKGWILQNRVTHNLLP
jgi:hypothetical protein